MTVLAAEAAAPAVEGVAAEAAGSRAAGPALTAKGPRSKGLTQSEKKIAEKLPASADSKDPDPGNPVKEMAKAPRSPIQNTSRRNVKVANLPKLGLGGTTKSGHTRTLKIAFLVLFLFLLARLILDSNKPRGGQIISMMLAFLILAFAGETQRVGKIAALLGLLVMFAVLMHQDSQAFVGKIASFAKGLGSNSNG